MSCKIVATAGPCEMVRKRGAYISSLTNFKRRKLNRSSTGGLWTWLSSGGLCAAFIVSNLICGICAEVDWNGSGRSAVGGVIADGQPPELKSIEHNIEEQCFQNCAKQVEFLIGRCVDGLERVLWSNKWIFLSRTPVIVIFLCLVKCII